MKSNYGIAGFVMFILIVINSLQVEAQSIITQWNFDSTGFLPSTGTGIATNTGGTTTDWVTGMPGQAWNTKSYPSQGTGSGSAGAEFSLSTIGFCNILITWNTRFSNTAANRIRLQYTINGTDWVDFEASSSNAVNQCEDEFYSFDNGRFTGDIAGSWFNRSADLSGIEGISDNPLFAIRLVTEFVDNNVYEAVSEGSSYNTAGTIRYDNVTVLGTVISSVSDVTESMRFLCFDNEIFIEPSYSEAYQVIIYSLSGFPMSILSLDGPQKIRTNLPKGMYIATLKSKYGVSSKKFFCR